MNCKLYFDSSDSFNIIVRLYQQDKLLVEKTKLQKFTSQALLPLINQVCQTAKIKITHISAVEFNTGPGSYTGLKVGAAIANTLGWFLKIPVNGKINIPIEPVYQ